jgi:hypothetical protein
VCTNIYILMVFLSRRKKNRAQRRVLCSDDNWLRVFLPERLDRSTRGEYEHEQRLETGSKAHTKNLKQTNLFNQPFTIYTLTKQK